MDFETGPPPRRPEAVLPMINLVFLLLVFFLLAATLAPPAPLRVTPATVGEAGPGAATELRVSLDAGGSVAFRELRGPAAMAAARAAAAGAPVAVHADRDAPARRLAEVVAGLGASGAGPLRLVVRER